MHDRAQHLIDEGYSARSNGEAEFALDRYQAAVEALHAIEAPQRLTHAIRHVADIQRGLKQSEDAESNYAEALALYRAGAATGKLDLANTLRGYALLREDTGDPAAARAMWLEARDIYLAVEVQAEIEEADQRIAIVDESDA
jgi:hypothetical protein